MEKLKTVLADKEAAIKDAPEDQKESMQRAIDGIKKTVDKAQQAIDDADKMKESTDTELWTINAMLAIIENQLIDFDNNYFVIND
jgi:peptidoglycan hydrolase CwlO-like protein